MKQSVLSLLEAKEKDVYGGQNNMDSDDLYDFMKNILSTKFFTEMCSFTKEERGKKEDWIALTKGMLLLDVHCNEKWRSEELSDAALIKYIKWMREHYDNCQRNTLRSVMEYLEEAYCQKKGGIKKEEIPELICKAGQAMYAEVNPTTLQNIALSNKR